MSGTRPPWLGPTIGRDPSTPAGFAAGPFGFAAESGPSRSVQVDVTVRVVPALSRPVHVVLEAAKPVRRGPLASSPGSSWSHLLTAGERECRIQHTLRVADADPEPDTSCDLVIGNVFACRPSQKG